MTKHVEDIYKKIAKKYSEVFFKDTSDLPLVSLLANSLTDKSQILDIGCGPGQFAKYLTDMGYLVTGIDSSPEMLSIARDKSPAVAFKQMDMRKLDFNDNTFDGVLAAYSIIHIPTVELDVVFKEVRRVLKPGGYLLSIVQEGDPDQTLDEPLAKGEKIFMNFFTEKRIKDITRRNGFTVMEQSSIHQSSDDVLSKKAIGTLAQLK